MRTVAVVVGVEKYDVGDQWDLNGPCTDVDRVVRMLKGFGVPETDITVHLSQRVEPQATRTGLWATRNDVYKTFAGLRDTESEFLFVYWGGHGVVDGEGVRRVFYQDASARDKRNLDLDSLAASLRSSTYPRHPRQLLVVDACQNLTTALRYAATLLPRETFPVGGRPPRRSQDILLAASPGEVAFNDATSRTGVFTREFLNVVAKSEQWPPNVESVAEELCSVFAQLRRQGQAAQTPAYLWTRVGGTEGSRIEFPPRSAGSGRMSIDCLARLMKALLDLDEIADPLNRGRIMLFMPNEIRSSIAFSENPRVHVVNWLRTCQSFPGGRAALIEVLRLTVSEHEGLANVLTTMDECWPVG